METTDRSEFEQLAVNITNLIRDNKVFLERLMDDTLEYEQPENETGMEECPEL